MSESSMARTALYTRSPGLVDILDRILDKGLVVAGDVKISLAHVELLKLQIRLLVCSADKAVEIGLDWWRTDSFYSGAPMELETRELQVRVRQLEQEVEKARKRAA